MRSIGKALFLFLTVGGGVAVAQETVLPPAVQVAIEQNTATLRRVTSVDARLERVREGHKVIVRLDSRRTPQAEKTPQLKCSSIHCLVKANAVREDTLEWVTTEWSANMDVETAFLAAGGLRDKGLPEERRCIFAVNACYHFNTADPVVVVSPGREGMPFQIETVPLYEHVLMSGKTLEDFCRSLATEGHQPVLGETTERGERRLLLTWDFPKVQMGTRVWLDPVRGMMISRLECSHRGKVFKDRQSRIKDYGGGVFWFESVEIADVDGQEGKVLKEWIRVTSAVFNVTIEDRVFTLDGLDVFPGTEMQNQTSGLRTRYARPTDPVKANPIDGTPPTPAGRPSATPPK